MFKSMKIIKIFLIASFPETHVLIITPLVISPCSYDQGHSKAVAHCFRAFVDVG
jgi:hypothetical protein